MKTAEEIYNNFHFNYKGDNNYIIEAMKEYAKKAIKEDRENVVDNIKIIKECGKENDIGCDAMFCRNCLDIIDKDSIINAPNIKLL